MLILHEVHTVRPGAEADFEACYRDGWMPTIGKRDDARLLWYFNHAAASSRAHSVVTYTALRDAAALAALNSSIERGDLRDWITEADTLRTDSVGTILVPTEFSELKDVDFATVPADPAARRDPVLFCEDTVWPPVLDDYIEMAGEHWYSGSQRGTTKVRARVEIPAFLTPADGAGRRPELYLVQRIVDPTEVFVKNLIAADYPPEMRQPDHYFVRGLKVRDQWESKILRTATWSPLA